MLVAFYSSYPFVTKEQGNLLKTGKLSVVKLRMLAPWRLTGSSSNNFLPHLLLPGGFRRVKSSGQSKCSLLHFSLHLPGHLGEFHPWLSTVTNCGQPMHHVHFKG
jgi:hypothetical protein